MIVGLKWIADWLNNWCQEGGIDNTHVQFSIYKADGKIHIYTDTPGALIGRQGNLFQKYKTALNEEYEEYRNTFIQNNPNKDIPAKLTTPEIVLEETETIQKLLLWDPFEC